MRNFNTKIVFLLPLFVTMLFGEVLIPNNKCALIVASRATKTESVEYIKNEVKNKQYVNLYQANNGWYAISVGFLKNENAKTILHKWKKIGKIPQDSFCAKANKFITEVNLNRNSNISNVAQNDTKNSETKQKQKPSAGLNICQYVSGASVIANDGKYLGKVSSEYSTESIFNEYGSYGGEYSSKSIWNEYGSYGGEYSSNSPFNEYTSTPPVLVKNGTAIAYLSVNKALSGAVNPNYLKTCTFY